MQIVGGDAAAGVDLGRDGAAELVVRGGGGHRQGAGGARLPFSSESHGHIQTTGDAEDLLVSGGTKTDIPCCVVINWLDGAAADRGADRIAVSVLGASAGAGDRIAAEVALGGAAGARARGSNAHRGELQILGFGHQLQHLGAGIRGGCVGEAAVLHRRAGGGAEVVNGNGKTDGDR